MHSRELLAIESSPEGDVVHVHGYLTGLRRLAAQLLELAEQAETGGFLHLHLFSPDWGGYELVVLLHDLSNTTVHHLKLFGWPTVEGGLPYRASAEG